MKKSLITLIVFLLMATSCTMEKRRYNRGWHVEYFGNNGAAKRKSDMVKPRAGHYVSSDKVAHFYTLNDTLTGSSFITEASFGVEQLSVRDNAIKEHESSEAREVTAVEIQNSERHQVIKSSANAKPIRSKIQKRDKSKAKANAIKSTKKKSDWLLYLSSGGIAFLAFGFMGINRKLGTKITRWAKANKFKTKLTIAGLQLSLTGMAVWMGYNLGQLGLEFSDSLRFVAIGIAALGLSVAPFFRRKNTFLLPHKLKIQRFGFIGATLAFLLIAVGTGNQINSSEDGSIIKTMMQQVDQTIFAPIDNGMEISEAQINQLEKRKIIAGVMSGGSGVIIGLLAFLLCIGVCSIGFGIGITAASITWDPVGALGGLALTAVGMLLVSVAMKELRKVIIKDYLESQGTETE